jgi:hypothetical protein
MDLLDTAFGDTGSRMVHHRVFGKSAPDGGIVSLVWAKVRYVAHDPRLQAMNLLEGPEELRQAVHRSRAINRDTPMVLLIFSPWDLTELGLTPTTMVEEVSYPNSKASREALRRYKAV